MHGSVQNTSLTCATGLDSAGRLAYIVPDLVVISPTLIDSSVSSEQYECPLITIAGEEYSTVTVSTSYYHESLCSCREKYFGVGSQCRPSLMVSHPTHS